MKKTKNILLPTLLLTLILSSCGSLQLNRPRYTGGMHISFNKNKKESIGVTQKKIKHAVSTLERDTNNSTTITPDISPVKEENNSLEEAEQTKVSDKEACTTSVVFKAQNQIVLEKIQKTTITKLRKQGMVASAKKHPKEDDEDLSLLARIGKVFLFVLLISAALTGILVLSGLSFSSALSLVGFYWLCLIIYGAITLLVIFLLYLWVKSLFS